MRVKRGFAGRKRHKRRIKLAAGFRGRRNNCFKHVKLGVQKALKYAYRDRRTKKREFRSLWIIRIGAAAKLSGISYSKFMFGLKKANIELDRKMLADLAVNDAKAFAAIVDKAKAAI